METEPPVLLLHGHPRTSATWHREDTTAATEKRMRLRYAGSCRLRGTELAARAEAVYEDFALYDQCHSQAGLK